MKKPKDIGIMALCLTLLIISFFYILLTTAGDGYPTIVEPDQRIYLQYARNIASGYPYVFSIGDAPSTGSTSYLYPLILSIPYKFTAENNSIIAFSFALNSLFYIGVIFCVWSIAKNLYPRMAFLALFLSILAGHTASALFGQTDVGLFTLLALALFATILYEKKWASLILIGLCSITRPEGFIFSVAFLLTGISGLILNLKHPNAPGTTRQAKWFILYSLIGFTSFGTTLLTNHYLTGHTQFMSVANKGYFNVYPFWGALDHTLHDLLALIKGFFFGLPNTFRQFYHFPLLAGFLGISGILLYPRKNKTTQLCECWLLLSAGATLLTVASSQYQGLSNDRYLAWIFPIWTLYILIGVFELNNRLKSKHFLPVVATLLILFQMVSLAHVASRKYSFSISRNQERIFAEQIQDTLEPSSRLGSAVGAGLLFHIPERVFYNISGITSPDFFSRHYSGPPLPIIDLLKHRPDLRFEYWIAPIHYEKNNPWAKPFIGKVLITDTSTALSNPKANGIFQANWQAITGGGIPQLITNKLSELQLIDSLDIGYFLDEEEHDYENHLRLRNLTIPLCFKHAKLGPHSYSETGRIVMGKESFTIHNAKIGKAIQIVMRTAQTASGICHFGRGSSTIQHLEMNKLLSLHLVIDGKVASTLSVPVVEEEFDEVLLEVPKEYVQSESLKIEIIGDHISFAFWVYQ